VASLWAALLLCGCAGPGRLSAVGESCGRTADCVAQARCLDQVCVAGAGGADLTTVEGLARAIVAAVASGRPEGIQALLLTEAELRELAQAAGWTPERTGLAVATGERLRGQLQRRWQRLLAAAAELGVRLEALRYAGVVPFRTAVDEGVEVVESDLQIRVTAEGRPLVLDVEECVRARRGWVLADPEVELERPRGGATGP
jgi:hypothetical protein